MALSTTTSNEQYIFTGSEAARGTFNRRTASSDASHLMPHLRRGMRVVDFGCGTGSITLGLAAAVAPGEVFAFDISEAAVAQATMQARQAGIRNVTFAVADIHALDLANDSFDVAHFCGVLAHLPEPAIALELGFWLLRPGGVLAAREPQKEGDWFGGPYHEAVGVFNRLLIEDWKAAGGDPFLGRRFGLLLRAAGFERVEIAPGCAPALSSPAAWAGAARRIGEPDFAQRVVRRGWISAEQLAALSDAIALWAASPDSVVATAECIAIGWKPR